MAFAWTKPSATSSKNSEEAVMLGASTSHTAASRTKRAATTAPSGRSYRACEGPKKFADSPLEGTGFDFPYAGAMNLVSLLHCASKAELSILIRVQCLKHIRRRGDRTDRFPETTDLGDRRRKRGAAAWAASHPVELAQAIFIQSRGRLCASWPPRTDDFNLNERLL
jgi:hypothetical protein